MPQSRESLEIIQIPLGEITLEVLCNTTFTHVILFNPRINFARGENIVKGSMHHAIKEMILLRSFAMGRMLINYECFKENEGGLGFSRGRSTRAPFVNLMGVMRKDGSYLTH